MGFVVRNYARFGAEALPIIADVLSRQGCALGLKKPRPNRRTRGSRPWPSAFAKSLDPNLVKVISVFDQVFHIQYTRCPFGRENTSRELCEKGHG